MKLKLRRIVLVAMFGLGATWYILHQAQTYALPGQPSPLTVEKIAVVRRAPVAEGFTSNIETIRVRIAIRRKRPWLRRQDFNIWRFSDSYIVDNKGQKFPAATPLINGNPFFAQGITGQYNLSDYPTGLVYFETIIPTRQFADHSNWTYVTHLALNQCQPMTIKTPLLKGIEWTQHRSSLLKITNITVYPPNVIVSFSTTGKAPLSLRSNGMGSPWGDTYRFNGRDYLPIKTEPNKVRLFSSWSEHLEGRIGKSSSTTKVHVSGSSSSWSNRVWTKDVSFDEQARTGSILYEIQEVESLTSKEPWWFVAKIGLEGDGFLPIKIQVRDAAGHWLTRP